MSDGLQGGAGDAPLDDGVVAGGGDQGGTGGSFKVPDDYAGKGWAEKIKSQDDVWKLLDNSQSLLGKRVMPPDDAPQEEWDNFYKNIGRPEKPDEYNFSDVEGLPEDFDPAEFQQQARQIMHEAGLNKKQADKLYQLYLKSELETANKNREAIQQHQEALYKEFDEITGKIFDGKFEEVSAKAQSFIKNNLPEELIPVVADLQDNPKAFAAVIALADKAQKEISGIKAKYGAEDNLNTGAQAGGVDKDAVLKQLTEAKVRAKTADPFSSDRKKADAEIQELRQRLQSFFK